MSIFCKYCKFYKKDNNNEDKIYACDRDTGKLGKTRCSLHENDLVDSSDIVGWAKNQLFIFNTGDSKFSARADYVIKTSIYFMLYCPDKLTIRFSKVLTTKLNDILDYIEGDKKYSDGILKKQTKLLIFLHKRFIEYKQDKYEYWLELVDMIYNSEGKELFKNLF